METTGSSSDGYINNWKSREILSFTLGPGFNGVSLNRNTQQFHS